MYEGWKQQLKNLTIDMRGEELSDILITWKVLMFHSRAGWGSIAGAAPGLFQQGFIGLASPDEQPPETLNILERFAYVFNLHLPVSMTCR